MKMLLIPALILLSSSAFALSGTSSNGTCFSYTCKIVLDAPTKDAALEVLAGAPLTPQIHAMIKEQRALLTQSLGQEAAKNLSDFEVLTYILSN